MGPIRPGSFLRKKPRVKNNSAPVKVVEGAPSEQQNLFVYDNDVSDIMTRTNTKLQI